MTNIRCPSCSKEISREADVCPSCGYSLDGNVTRRFDERPKSDAVGSGRTISSPFNSIDDSRYVPGTILAGRYRIVGLIGKGGMGEVYRADDLKLAQAVALKFLPDNLSTDGAALARFHREVRVARQVSHRNVCRVYDIGEADGRQFLSMEYIKGEELSSLLRRVGRLPVEKSVQLARQICAGLNAAHDVGVLHRDLKPANVMIDSDGNARILDFGLGGLSEEFHDSELAAGTPAYMAPEQLDGKEQTVKTDIYSLGLVLYELFTGKKAFEARTLHDLIELRRNNTTPTSLSSLVKDVDPVIERVIDRCIQSDPALRPASPLQVAAALPGGDPIAAALAAGETPSPEMVAAAPKQGILNAATASALFLSFVVLLGTVLWLTRFTAVYRFSPIGDPPDVLRSHAREISKSLGYAEPPVDSADGIVLKQDYLRYIAEHDTSPTRWDKMRTSGPGAYRFWYRQSPRYFETVENIEVDRPALDVSGMASLYLDMAGKLHWFIGVPPQREQQSTANPKADWTIAFRHAGLDIANFQPAVSSWIPLHAYDERSAWDGIDVANTQEKIHVEAAAFHGKLVYFETIYPWDSPLRQEVPAQSQGDRLLTFILIAITLVVMFGSVMLARRNLRLGRGDRRGATRLAIFYLIAEMLVWLFSAHHNGVVGHEFGLFFVDLALGLMNAVFLWLLYVALEPFIRKRWPDWIISWNRLLVGDYRDPLVGRDVLVGCVIGATITLLQLLFRSVPRWLGRPMVLSITPASERLDEHSFFGRFLGELSAGLFFSFVCVFLLLLFVSVLRRERLALGALWLLLAVISVLLSNAGPKMIPFTVIPSFLVIFALKRFGLLALTSTLFVAHLGIFFPITTEFTAWYARDFLIALVIVLAMAAFAFYISLGGGKIFKGGLFED